MTPLREFFTQARESTPEFDSLAPFVGGFNNVFNDVTWQIRPCDGLLHVSHMHFQLV